MYHIKDDKRMVQSAEILLASLCRYCKSNAFNDLTIAELSRSSGLGRSTIYRLFDNIYDIVEYGCDRFAETLVKNYKDRKDSTGFTRNSFLLFSLEQWMSASDLVELLIACKRPDIMHNSMKKFSEGVPAVRDMENVSETEKRYIEATIGATFASIIVTWIRNGKKETPEEVYHIFMKMMMPGY